MKFDEKEIDSILASLRLLQTSIENRLVLPNDGDIGEILTNSGSHEGLTVCEIDALIEAINTDDSSQEKPRVLVVVNGGVADPVYDSGVDVHVFDWDDYNDDPNGNSGVPHHFADLANPLKIPVAAMKSKGTGKILWNADSMAEALLWETAMLEKGAISVVLKAQDDSDIVHVIITVERTKANKILGYEIDDEEWLDENEDAPIPVNVA